MNAIKWSAAALSLLFLAACSGGGGGSGGPVVSAPKEAEPITQEDFRKSVSGKVLDLLSGTEPVFGSVGVSTGPLEGIESTFDGQRTTVIMNRGGAGDVTLDTANAYADTDNEASYVDLPGRTGRTRYVFDATDTSATLGLVATDWMNNNPDDYLAGGYWLHAEGQPLVLEIGAFIDGPELNLNDPPVLPISGTADYRGSSAGLYASVYGTDGGVPLGSTELGEFFGIATLNADFSAGTIDGCVGCEGDIYLSGVYENIDTGALNTFENIPRDYEVNFGSVPFDRNNGTFQGSNVTLSSVRAPITQSNGVWAGQFSNIPNNSGDPRLVGGTFGGQAETAGGTKALFLGAFAAGAQ